ncbi:MAG TPA: hypothetical protein VF200_01875 [Woeseiaceae bacterium]
MAYKNIARDREIWAKRCAGMSTADLAREYRLSVRRVEEICSKHRGAMTMQSRDDIRAEYQAQLDRARQLLQELIEAPLPPAFQGGEALRVPGPDEDSPGELVRDAGTRLQAIKRLVEVQARAARLLGLDAPEKIEQSGIIRYEIAGVDMEKLR